MSAPVLERWHRARKEHTCDQCHEPIKPGDSYQVTVVLPHVASYRTYDGYDHEDVEFTTLKTCLPCVNREREPW